jgi:hypothetical protein
MNRTGLVVAIVMALAKSVVPVPAISYFTNVRDVRLSQPGTQNYFVVDEEIWNHARPDLADLRIYDGESQVQYALNEQRGGISSHELPAKILNLGEVGGHTEFDLDMLDRRMGELGEYDRIRLELDAKDFVVTATIAGSNELASTAPALLPPATLYDFSREELGSNSVLKLPPTSFRYLHVKLSNGILPSQVKSASVFNLQETKAGWTRVSSCGAPSQIARTTVVVCNSSSRVPIERVRLHVDQKQINFRRSVAVTDSGDRRIGIGGEITRVRMNRGGTTVVSEDMDVRVGEERSAQLKIIVDNGDNQPLAISGVDLLSAERRVYFDPEGKSQLKLYYGDEMLFSPVYDYARFFKADPSAAQAELGPGTHNEAYRGRPDNRPWSEQHKAVLWLAMILAVVVLAALAIRGMKTMSS